jgi:hypothetical protein
MQLDGLVFELRRQLFEHQVVLLGNIRRLVAGTLGGHEISSQLPLQLGNLEAGLGGHFGDIVGSSSLVACQRRLQGARGRIVAKTGTLAHASTLAGYLTTASGDRLAFAILVDNYAGGAREAQAAIDAVALALAAQ